MNEEFNIQDYAPGYIPFDKWFDTTNRVTDNLALVADQPAAGIVVNGNQASNDGDGDASSS